MADGGEAILSGAVTVLGVGVLANTLAQTQRAGQQPKGQQPLRSRQGRPGAKAAGEFNQDRKQHRERFLDAWWDHNPKTFDKLFKLRRGAGDLMISDMFFDHPTMAGRILSKAGFR